jgi:hypothetical protein
MEKKIKIMSIEEFIDEGFLQEANRKFFHPLGLALSVKYNDDDGTWSLHEIWDYRDDPEGMFFGDDILDKKKIRKVEELRKSKINARIYNHKYFDVDNNGIQVE